jgi:hypothetical protein
MKKWLASLVAVSFLASVSGPIFAAPATPGPAPAAKSMKHKKKTHKKKGSQGAKAGSTPTAK